MRTALVGAVAAVVVTCTAGSAPAVRTAPSAPAPASSAVSLAAAPIEHVGATAASRTTASAWVQLPATVAAGDRLLLLVSVNAANRRATTPAGWALEGDRAAGTMRTLVWSRVATASDAGARVTVALDGAAKSTLHVAAYRGLGDAPLAVVSRGETTAAVARTTPTVAVPADGAWVVSFWAAKSSTATTLAPPADVTSRGAATHTGSGRVVSLLADPGAPVAAGPYGAKVARADATTGSATTWSIVLPPAEAPSPGVVEVAADDETDPVAAGGDAADDPAVWVHPEDPASSLVIGNDKQGALEVYGLDGARVQRITTATSFWGNVDVRQGVTLGGRTRDLVLAYNAGIRAFDVDAAQGRLVAAGDGSGAVPTNGGEGLCAYHSPAGDLYAYAITRAGRIRQYRLHDSDGDGLVQGTLVREVVVGSEAEGCVADDATGRLYVSEEDVGLWRYGAEPSAGSTRTLVDDVTASGHLAYDVEGVTLTTTGDAGHLIVSAQNGADPDRSYFVVYDRVTNAYLGSFRITGGAAADGCERTDGVTAYAGDLGPAFPSGIFVCQDNGNTAPAPGFQNFKLTRLEKVLP